MTNPRDRLEVLDNRTSRAYTLAVADGAIRASELGQIRVGDNDPGLTIYDPGLVHTATCRSAITYVDGLAGQLLYRGYAIDQLVDRSSFLEVAYMLLHGELPRRAEWDSWIAAIQTQLETASAAFKFVGPRGSTCQPQTILISALAAMRDFGASTRDLSSRRNRVRSARAALGSIPVLAVMSLDSSMGRRSNPVFSARTFARDLLRLLTHQRRGGSQEHVLARALEILLIIHADHEQNCSTTVVRAAASTGSDPYTCLTAGAAALSGPLHGGAVLSALQMLEEIESPARIRAFLKTVKAGERRLMGFGHRVYKTRDPRAKVAQRVAAAVYEVTDRDRLADVATQLENAALMDEYFVRRHIFPNADFYTGLIYRSLGIAPPAFPLISVISRSAGWLANWLEASEDPDRRLFRPHQIYVGDPSRAYPGSTRTWSNPQY